MSVNSSGFAELAIRLLKLSQSELNTGLTREAAAQSAPGHEQVYEWARATRCFTRAQVRALQVCQGMKGQP